MQFHTSEVYTIRNITNYISDLRLDTKKNHSVICDV